MPPAALSGCKPREASSAGSAVRTAGDVHRWAYSAADVCQHGCQRQIRQVPVNSASVARETEAVRLLPSPTTIQARRAHRQIDHQELYNYIYAGIRPLFCRRHLRNSSRNLSCNSVCTVRVYTVLMVRTYGYFGPSLHAEHYFYCTVVEHYSQPTPCSWNSFHYALGITCRMWRSPPVYSAVPRGCYALALLLRQGCSLNQRATCLAVSTGRSPSLTSRSMSRAIVWAMRSSS